MKKSQTTVRQQAKRTSSSGSGHHLSSGGATRAQNHETGGFTATPPHPRRSNKELAEARPPAHAKSAAHRSRQASSSRVRKMEGSERALALARSRTNVHVSQDDQSGPGAGSTSSGQVHSFRRRVTCNATPSMWAVPGRTVPSQWRGLPQLPAIGHRVLVGPVGPGLEPSRWWAPASAHTLATAFSTANPRLANDRLHTRCTMMAKGIELAATSAVRIVARRGRRSLRSSKTREVGRNPSGEA